MRQNRLRAALVVAAWLPSAAAGDGVDRYGDPLPPGAVARFGFLRVGSSSPLNIAEGPLAAFSPDGKLFASVCRHRIHLWDTATGRVKQRLQIGDEQVGRVLFVNEGKWLLAQSGSRLRAWDVASGREVYKDIPGMFLWGNTPLSPSGRWFIDARGDVWDLPAAKKVAHFNQIPRVTAFSADERSLFLATFQRTQGKDEYTLEQWDVATATRRRTFPDFAALWLAVSPDGRTLAAVRLLRDPKVVNKHTFRMVLFDVIDGRELHRFPERLIHFRQPVFSRDGKQLAAVDARYELHLWDVPSGKTLRTWTYNRDDLRFLAFSPDGQWLGACGQEGTAVLWHTTRAAPRFLTEEIHRRATALIFSRDGKQLVSGHTDGSIRFSDVATQQTLRTLQFGDSPAYSAIPFLAWADDPRYLIFQKPKGEFAFLDLETGKDLPLSLGKGIEVLGAHGRTLIVGPPRPDRHNFQWKPLSPEQLEAARKHAQARPELRAFRVVTPAPATDADTTGMMTFKRGGAYHAPAYPAVVSSDGKYVVESVMTIAGSPFTGMGTYWSPKTLRLVDSTTGRVLRDLSMRQRGLTFAPDGRSLLVWPDPQHQQGELRLLESRTGGERWHVVLPKPVGNVALSPCGRWVAVTAYEEDGLFLLDASTGKTALEHRPGRLYYGMDPLAFSPDGTRLARSCGDGSVLLWRTPAAPAKARALTPDELAAAWRDLADRETTKAFAAIVRLSEAPASALPMLKKALLQEEDADRVEKLIAELSSAVFADRQRATRELQRLGHKARPFLAKALGRDPPLESRKRLETLLTTLADPFATPEGLRQLRALEVLERIASRAARQILEKLAEGTADDPLALEAKLTVQRLQRVGGESK